MNLGYWLYMNEAEGTGLVDTRQSKINAVGKALREMGYAGKTVPQAVFISLCEKYKLNNPTKTEISQIEERWL